MSELAQCVVTAAIGALLYGVCRWLEWRWDRSDAAPWSQEDDTWPRHEQ